MTNRLWLRTALAVAGGVLLTAFGGSTRAAGAPQVSPPVPRTPIPARSLLPTAPYDCGLDPLPSSVTLCWIDRSTNEQAFAVYKRDAAGAWEKIDQVPTRNGPGVGDYYSFTDNATDISGQCYMIAAVGQLGAGDSPEDCTVRPDPGVFPQVVPPAARVWNGLSDVNDGTGDLYNRPRGRSLVHASETFGVDLDWSSKTALWKIEAQGGPHVMLGQAVALRVWGGGWLAYGHETWGVDLVLSSTPSYEWYVVGVDRPGTPIDSRPAPLADEFALWNSRAKTYLISRYQTWGVSLDWYHPAGSAFGTLHDATVTMTAQPPVEGYVPFLGSFGGGPGNTAVLTKVADPPGGVRLFFVKPGDGTDDCGKASDVIALGPGQTMAATDMRTLWGSATPSLAQQLPFLACAATQASKAFVNVEYRSQ